MQSNQPQPPNEHSIKSNLREEIKAIVALRSIQGGEEAYIRLRPALIGNVLRYLDNSSWLIADDTFLRSYIFEFPADLGFLIPIFLNQKVSPRAKVCLKEIIDSLINNALDSRKPVSVKQVGTSAPSTFASLWPKSSTSTVGKSMGEINLDWLTNTDPELLEGVTPVSPEIRSRLEILFMSYVLEDTANPILDLFIKYSARNRADVSSALQYYQEDIIQRGTVITRTIRMPADYIAIMKDLERFITMLREYTKLPLLGVIQNVRRTKGDDIDPNLLNLARVIGKLLDSKNYREEYGITDNWGFFDDD